MRIKVRKVDNQFLYLDIFYFCDGNDLKAQYHKKNKQWMFRQFNQREGVYSDLYSPHDNERKQLAKEAKKYLGDIL